MGATPEVQLVVVKEVANWRRRTGSVAKKMCDVVYYLRSMLQNTAKKD
jgi:hypothetical protein